MVLLFGYRSAQKGRTICEVMDLDGMYMCGIQTPFVGWICHSDDTEKFQESTKVSVNWHPRIRHIFLPACSG
jgi:hypothetical protein